MNYYKRHIGDYAAKAGHLSMLEHGAYGLLMDAYYNREEGPTRAEAIRLARARSTDEVAAVDAVLAEFFTESNGRYTQRRIEDELACYRDQAQTNKRIAVEREAKKRATNDARVEHEPCPLREPSHKPLAISHEKAKEEPMPVDTGLVDSVLAAYHSQLPRCMACGVVTPKRRRRIQHADKLAKSACLQRGWGYDPEQFWTAYFSECADDPWMRGDVPNPKNPKWKQSLDVLLDEERFGQIMDRAIAQMGATP